jgi:glycosyltransferase involved in cell wall biosynthesis
LYVNRFPRIVVAPRGGRMRIVFYCGDNVVPWDPSSLYSGIGGSEEAAIHMATQLAALGCDVSVYGTPRAGLAAPHAGVRWRRYETFGSERPGDVFIAWRNADFVQFSTGWRQVYHWQHNRQDLPYPDAAAARIDRVLVVSRHHAADAGFDGLDRRKIHITSNGLDAAFLRPAGNNEPDRAIYASCPARGLLAVLQMWPEIRRAVPTASLDVYHGFDAVYYAMADCYPRLRDIETAIVRLLDQDGVTLHGMVGQDVLAEGFARAGVWVYPTECPETSCITAMKALAMGCLPVTSGYAVLGETLGGRDYGPVHPTRRITESRWRLWRFRRQVIASMRRGASPAIAEQRLEWSQWARQRYAWPAIARDWMALFHAVDCEKGAAHPNSVMPAYAEAVRP